MAFSMRKLRLKFLVPAGLAFVVTLGVGVGLFVHSNAIMAAKIRQEMLTAATVAAMQFRSDNLLTLDSPEDASRSLFKDVAARLHDIRVAVPNAKFVYIFRKTDDLQTLKFVADADAIRTPEELDRNKNGTVDSDEVAALPGELYDIADQPQLQGELFEQPLVTPVYQDQWGVLITAIAPLDDPHFALGIDIDAAEFVRLSQSVLSPAALMLFAFLALLLATYLGMYLWRRNASEKQRIASIRSNVVRLSMHQLGAPLASMRWWLDILREQTGPDGLSPQKAEAHENISNALQRTQDLLQALQSADRSATGGLGDVTGVASLRDAISLVQTELQPELLQKKQVLHADIASEISVRIRPDLLKGILHELLENAVTYSPENTSILVHARTEKQWLILTVSDSGCGIPADELPYVFDEFHRGKDAAKYNSIGGGLGLFVVRNIVEAVGGRVSVRSEPGSGAAFTIRLPLA